MHLQNNLAKFHPAPIWKDVAVHFFVDGRHKNNEKEQQDK